MARKLDPISLAMLEYIQAVDKVFGLSTPVQRSDDSDTVSPSC